MNIREFAHRALARYPGITVALQPVQAPLRAVLKTVQYWQVVQQSRRAKLELICRATMAQPSKVIAILTVRNERMRLPACLLHHRTIGIEEFYIVDNGSDDGTLEYLSKQPDVTLYHTDESYRASYYGISWINKLMHMHAAGRWILFIDADELFYYRGMEQGETLTDLAERLETKGQTYFYAPLIDLYGFEDRVMFSVDSITELRSLLRGAWQDVDGYRSASLLRNGYSAIKGGPRGRLATLTATPEPSLVKYPLIQHHPNRYFTASAHEFVPQLREQHDEAGWLIHLKLGNDAHLHHSNPVIEREHYGGGSERRQIAIGNAAKALGGDPTAVYFGGIHTLNLIAEKLSRICKP